MENQTHFIFIENIAKHVAMDENNSHSILVLQLETHHVLIRKAMPWTTITTHSEFAIIALISDICLLFLIYRQVIFRSHCQYFDSENIGTALVILDLISIKTPLSALKLCCLFTALNWNGRIQMDLSKMYIWCTDDVKDIDKRCNLRWFRPQILLSPSYSNFINNHQR